jgi:glycosyltransferase involved in cell wall biosynthesis
MKKLLAAALLIAFAGACVPAYVYAADSSGMEDTVIDKASDWIAVLGKSEDEMEAILAERRADRAAERLSKAMRQAGKKAEKKMKKFGKDMEKLFE